VAATRTQEPLDARETVFALARAAREAVHALGLSPTDQRNRALTASARLLRERAKDIIAANTRDMNEAKGLSAALTDRLMLDAGRVEAMAKAVEEVAALPDPLGQVIGDWTRPNGLRITRVRVPLGVIGIIYESRPNVTADAGALCLKSGNAAILRGGSESLHSSTAIAACLADGLREANLPPAAIQLVPTRDREAVGAMLAASGLIDIIVPRGGKSLIERVQKESRIPVIAHLEGICHVYLDRAADPEMARKIVFNAKMRRTGVCGACETVLVDRPVAGAQLPAILDDLAKAGCEIRGDATVQKLDRRVVPASETDWETEYLDAIVSIKVVDGVGDAIDHINRHGSHHTDSIVTRDEKAAKRFLEQVDSAIVLHNASTQFADGGEFGMGAEIGISTGRLHARGPVGIEQLTTYKYVVHGTGQVRP
jgi:glutamate-5-semialdehyde dehydrogenase